MSLKNVLKMFWIRFLLQRASLSIIPQKSPISQKFLPFQSPKNIDMSSKNFCIPKNFGTFLYFDFISRCRGSEISDRSVIFGVWC